MNRSSLFRIVGPLAAVVLFSSAQAQENPTKYYPNKPIRVIVPYAAGGGYDLVARFIGPKLADTLGQPVIVENKPGAGGNIAAEYVAKAGPDGYMLLYAPASIFTVNPIFYQKIGYSLSDFVPISTTVKSPFVAVVKTSQPFRSITELVAYLKANPQSANISGTAGIFQLAYELFKSRTGIQGEYIAYKGANQAISAVISGEVFWTLMDTGPLSGALKGGLVRGLAVTSKQRLESYPDIPTVAEAGFPELEMHGGGGYLAPVGTPNPIVRKLQEEVNRIVRSVEFVDRMKALDVKAEGSTSEQFADWIISDLARWRAVAKAHNVRPTN